MGQNSLKKTHWKSIATLRYLHSAWMHTLSTHTQIKNCWSIEGLQGHQWQFQERMQVSRINLKKIEIHFTLDGLWACLTISETLLKPSVPALRIKYCQTCPYNRLTKATTWQLPTRNFNLFESQIQVYGARSEKSNTWEMQIAITRGWTQALIQPVESDCAWGCSWW